MATEIKAIECPKCGSTDQTELRPGVFRCGNCGTEYFLDGDTGSFRYVAQPAPLLPAGRPPARILPGLLLLLALAGGSWWLFGHHATAAPAADTYRWDARQSCLYLGPGHRPMVFAVGSRTYSGFGQDSAFAVFEDATADTVLRGVPFPFAARNVSHSFELRQFANGDLYVVADNTTVYQANPVTYALTDVTRSLFANQPALASGIASIRASNDDNDSFNLFTNDGRNLTYYPLLHQVYTTDELYVAQHGFRSVRPGSAVQISFTFSRPSYSYPDDKIALIRYQYQGNNGGPYDLPRFSWDDDFGGSGVFTNADPHRKVLISPDQMELSRVLSFRDFTPGRLYFGPAVVYSDADYVLITFEPTAAPNSPTTLQCLDARTAAIVFTLPLPPQVGTLTQAVRSPTGFVLSDGSHTYPVGLDGHLLAKPQKPAAQ